MVHAERVRIRMQGIAKVGGQRGCTLRPAPLETPLRHVEGIHWRGPPPDVRRARKGGGPAGGVGMSLARTRGRVAGRTLVAGWRTLVAGWPRDGEASPGPVAYSRAHAAQRGPAGCGVGFVSAAGVTTVARKVVAVVALFARVEDAVPTSARDDPAAGATGVARRVVAVVGLFTRVEEAVRA